MSKPFRFVYVVALMLLTGVTHGTPEFTVDLPVGKNIKRDGILPLRIRMRTTDEFIGRIHVFQESSQNYETVIPVRVGKGTFTYQLPFPLDGSAGECIVYVRLMSRQLKKPLEKKLKPHTYDPYYNGCRLVGWAGKRQPLAGFEIERFNDNWYTAFTRLDGGQRGALAGENPGTYGTSMTVSQKNTVFWSSHNGRINLDRCDFRFHYLLSGRLPTDFRMYQPLDVLVLEGTVARNISVEQAEAIADWVRCGGRLITIGDAIIDNVAGDPLMVAFEELPSVSSDKLSSIPHGFGWVMHVPELPVLLKSPENVEATGEDGAVTSTPKDVSPDKAKSVREDLVGQLFRVLVEQDYIAMSSVRKNQYGNAYTRTVQSVEVTAENLVQMTGLEPISFWAIIIYLLIFVVTVTIGERIIIHKVGKRYNLTWVLTPICVVLFFIGSGIISRAFRGTQPRNSGVHILDYSKDGICVESTYSCIVPSWHTSWKFEGRKDALQGPLPYTENQFDGQAVGVDLHTLFTAPVWGNALLRESVLSRAPAPCKSTLEADSGGAIRQGRVIIPKHLQGFLVGRLNYQGKWYVVGSDGQVDGQEGFEKDLGDRVTFQRRFTQAESWTLGPDDYADLFPGRSFTRDEQSALLVLKVKGAHFRKIEGQAKRNHVMFVRQMLPVTVMETNQ